MALHRRQVLQFMGAAPFVRNAGTGGGQRGWSELPSLRDIARERGFRYGATPETDLISAPPQFKDLFVRHCGLLAPVLPWHLSRRPGAYEFDIVAGNVAFAQAHDMMLTGSHLLWHEWLPNWFVEIDDHSAAERAVVDHVRALAAGFAGQVYSWNVVNEAIELRDGHPSGLRRCALLSKLGDGYIDLAFRVAHEADPGALLLYNDKALEGALPQYDARRRALFRLLDRLARKATPIGGIGLQSHLKVGMPFSERAFQGFLREIADRDLKICLTEVDVLDAAAPADIPSRDRLVADLYSRFLSAALENRAVTAVLTWGLSDRYTWLNSIERPWFKRLDDLSPRPLPFDSAFKPKPAFFAIAKAFLDAAYRPG
jgi:endo-1,4-beta-xylanase